MFSHPKIHTALRPTVLALLLLGGSLHAAAQSVIFPQEKQPGAAQTSENAEGYTLANDLFSAHFVRQDGKLLFGGCPEMNLQAGTELFRIRMADGTEASASQMTLGNVRTIRLNGNPDAAKGSERFDGQALEAEFAYRDLNITWRAVLRDGSHYLRTEMEITATAATADRKSVV